MKLKKINKKAFIITLFTLIFSIILFSIHLNDISKTKYFNEVEIYKIQKLNSDIDYFFNIYFDESLEYSTIASLYYLTNKSNNNFQNNHLKLNKILKNLIFYGKNSTDDKINFLKYKNLNFSINDFNEKNELNFSYKLNDFKIYETQSFYVNVLIDINYNFTYEENLSNWKVKNKKLIYKIPVLNLEQPNLKNKIIKSHQLSGNLSNVIYSISKIKNILENNHSFIIFENKTKQKIGKSYLNRLLNSSKNSIQKNKIFSYVVDYDKNLTNFYDNSLNSNLINNISKIDKKYYNDEFKKVLFLNNSKLNISLTSEISENFSISFFVKNLNLNENFSVNLSSKNFSLNSNESFTNFIIISNLTKISIYKNSKLINTTNKNNLKEIIFSGKNILLDEIHIYNITFNKTEINNFYLNPFSKPNGNSNYLIFDEEYSSTLENFGSCCLCALSSFVSCSTF